MNQNKEGKKYPYKETIVIFMANNYEVRFMEPAKEFLEKAGQRAREKILFNIWKSRLTNDPALFRKLSGNIWEFRTRYNHVQYRLFAFWDRSTEKTTLVIVSHGFIKKSQKTPKNEMDRAEQLRKMYFNF